MIVDVVVVLVVALAAWRGWRRGGTALVLAVAGAVLGVIAGAWVAGWWAPDSTVVLVGAIGVLGLVGLALGRRLADTLATRAGGRVARPVLVDRAVGVVAHGGLALVVCVALGALVTATGDGRLAEATDRSRVLTAASERLGDPARLAGEVPGLDRIVAGQAAR